MEKLMMIPGLCVCLSIGIFIFGCGTPAHRQIFKEDLSYTQQVYAYPQQILFRAVINSVLSAGFAIEREDGATQFVLAKRSFQQGKKCTVVVLQIKIAQLAAQKAIVYLKTPWRRPKDFSSRIGRASFCPLSHSQAAAGKRHPK